MPKASPARDGSIRFGVFELDVRAGELRKSGTRVRLQEQCLQILTMLLAHPGQVVTRDELRARLWPNGTVVDFEHSVNAAIKRLREALDDSADNPIFVETIPRRGYRFIAPVDAALTPSTSARAEVQAISGREEEAADSTRDPHIPETLGHYRMLDRLDAGAIGVVYRARNLRLGNDVAIKFLRSPYASDGNRVARFKQEARATAALHHPNILAVYDLGDSDGIPYIVSELLEGVTLRNRLQGPLPQPTAIHYAVQILKGLTAAHGKHIIHRDLKPENIFVTTDERVKILDFGIAKLKPSNGGCLEPAITDEVSTSAGAILGTVGYMSPEQVRGESSDERSDIFAFGTILYEMLTGQRAFAAPTPVETLSAILTAEPEELRPGKSSLPAAIIAVLQRCLNKSVANRFQSAQEVIRALEQLDGKPEPRVRQFPPARVRGPGIAAVLIVAVALFSAGYFYLTRKPHINQIASVAVLPLANLSGDPQQEYLADGITDSLITDLGRLTGLKIVIAREYVMSYKGSNKPLGEIARDLNVDALITGSVMQSGNRVRVTAQLINPETGQQLWSEHYERDASDIVHLQNDLTGAIAGEIRVKLTAEEQQRLQSVPSVGPEAYEAYLMGRFHSYKLSPKGLDAALQSYQLALKRDPNYAAAYAGVGAASGLQALYSFVPPKDGWEKSRIFALKALELDPNLPEAHNTLAGVLAWYDWNWEAGEKEYRRAIELNPNYADARCFYSLFLFAMRRQQEAKSQLERALELNPYSAFFHSALAMELLNEERTDEALMHLRQAGILQPDSMYVHDILERALEKKGAYEEAWAEAKEIAAISGVSNEVKKAMERGYAQDGYWGAKRAQTDALAAIAPHAGVQSFHIARSYALLGQDDLALDWLEKAYKEHSSFMPYMNAQHFFDRLRSHPRFQEVSGRMKFPPST